MSLKCWLGLIACLNSQGHWIPEDDVFVLLDNCNIIEQTTSNDFGDAVDFGEILSSLGAG